MTTKNYNRVFLTLTRGLRRDGIKNANLAKQLREQSGESSEWPSDSAFAEAWRTVHAYQAFNNPKIVHILKRLSDSYLTHKMEALSIESPVSIEHILPQSWIEFWPLQNGSAGMPNSELWQAPENDERAIATRRRNLALHSFGNLTILTHGLNSAVSNGPWTAKRPELLRHSLLPINQQLQDMDVWDESAIAARSEDLLSRALKIWPRPAEVAAIKPSVGAALMNG